MHKHWVRLNHSLSKMRAAKMPTKNWFHDLSYRTKDLENIISSVRILAIIIAIRILSAVIRKISEDGLLNQVLSHYILRFLDPCRSKIFPYMIVCSKPHDYSSSSFMQACTCFSSRLFMMLKWFC